MSWLDLVCHDCDAKVGELHELGCDMERCPLCGGQLISCSESHFSLVKQGLVGLVIINRIPYVQPLVNCGVCGTIYPELFNVPDAEWKKYVIPPLQDKVVCGSCYLIFKNMFPDGWRKVKA